MLKNELNNIIINIENFKHIIDEENYIRNKYKKEIERRKHN